MNEPQSFSPPPAKRKTGLSVTSLVLGILSVACFFIFTGIPAIITGHIARGRAKRAPDTYGGGGMALAGLIMGYISIVTTLFAIAMAASFILPAVAKMKQMNAQQTPCANNLQQIRLAARIWAEEHSNQFAPNFLTMSNELATPKVLVCDEDSSKTPAQDWEHFNPSRNATYEYLAANTKEEDMRLKPVLRCPIHRTVCLGDGSIKPESSKR